MFANFFYLSITLLGVYLLLRHRRYQSISLIWILVLSFYIILTLWIGIPKLSDFVAELRPLFVLPAGIAMQFLVRRCYSRSSYLFFILLLLSIGAFLAVLSGFSFRFSGAPAFPILGSIWVPTYATVLYFSVLSGIVRNRFLVVFSTLIIILSAVNTIIFSAFSLASVISVQKTLAAFLAAKLYIRAIILPFAMIILALVFVFVYTSRRTIDLYVFDYDALVKVVDRLAFYDAYVRAYLPDLSLASLAPLAFGHGVGVSVASWVSFLPFEFQNMNLVWYEAIGSTSLLFQIDLLRLGFSFGVAGLAFLMFSILYPFNLPGARVSFVKFLLATRLGWILFSLFAMSFLTITISTTGLFIGFSYVSSCLDVKSSRARSAAFS